MQMDYSSIDNCQSKISMIVGGAFGICVAFRDFMQNPQQCSVDPRLGHTATSFGGSNSTCYVEKIFSN